MADTRKDLVLSSDQGESVECRLANSFFSRLKGLMGQPPPEQGKGLLIRPCNSIHMFFMRFSIDVVFLDREFNIVRLVRNLDPGRIVGTVQDAWQVLEVKAGDMPESFMEGARLSVTRI